MAFCSPSQSGQHLEEERVNPEQTSPTTATKLFIDIFLSSVPTNWARAAVHRPKQVTPQVNKCCPEIKISRGRGLPCSTPLHPEGLASLEHRERRGPGGAGCPLGAGQPRASSGQARHAGRRPSLERPHQLVAWGKLLAPGPLLFAVHCRQSRCRAPPSWGRSEGELGMAEGQLWRRAARGISLLVVGTGPPPSCPLP